MHDNPRPAILLLESHRGDGPITTAFFIGPNDAGIGRHVDIAPEEGHGLVR